MSNHYTKVCNLNSCYQGISTRVAICKQSELIYKPYIQMDNMEELQSETWTRQQKCLRSAQYNDPSLLFVQDTVFEWNLAYIYASDRPTFSSIVAVEERTLSCDSSESKGWDSCLAAACNTRFWTSNDDGETGSPFPLLSTFPAARETACAPSFTGDSNKLCTDTQISIILTKMSINKQTNHTQENANFIQNQLSVEFFCYAPSQVFLNLLSTQFYLNFTNSFLHIPKSINLNLLARFRHIANRQQQYSWELRRF